MVILEWEPRFFISNKFPAQLIILVQGPHLGEQDYKRSSDFPTLYLCSPCCLLKVSNFHPFSSFVFLSTSWCPEFFQLDQKPISLSSGTFHLFAFCYNYCVLFIPLGRNHKCLSHCKRMYWKPVRMRIKGNWTGGVLIFFLFFIWRRWQNLGDPLPQVKCFTWWKAETA